MRPRDEASSRSPSGSEGGIALVAVLLTMALLLALAGGLLQVTVTESRIAAHHRAGVHVLHAAEAVVERIRVDAGAVGDVDLLLAGPLVSSFADGAPGGSRSVHGVTIDLTEITNLERCGRASACSEAAITTVTAERPFGVNNPRWRLFAHGWLHDLLGSAVGPAVYVVGWIGDDPDERDGDPLRDTPGQGRLALRIRAYGPQGARCDVDVVLAGLPGRPYVAGWVER